MKSNKKMNGLILCTVVAALVLSAFPMMTGALDGDDGNIPEPGRANEIVVNDISVILSEEEQVGGVYLNGNHLIEVNFTLTQDMMNVNVTLNASHEGAWELNTSEMGNYTAQTNYSGHEMDFSDPGMYTLNATMEAWLNGTGMVYGSKELAPINFTTVIDYEFDVALTGREAAGAYAKLPVHIDCVMNFTGNVMTAWTNVTVEIVNTSSMVAETDVEPGWFMMESLTAGIDSDPVGFLWIPSVEGPNSNYEITVTAINMTTGVNDSTTEAALVMNVTLFGLQDVGAPDGVPIDLPFNVTASVNNTGNVDGAAEVCLSIYEDGNPTNEVFNTTKTSGNIDLMFPTEIMFDGIVVDVAGDYKLKVRLLSTGETIMHNLTIIETPNVIPELTAHTPVTTVKEGVEAVFTVTYTDDDDQQGNVTLYLDDVPLAMVNATADWDAGVVFTYTWVAEGVGAHSYYFFAEDILNGNSTLKNATDEQFPLTVTVKTDGWLYGKVTDENGNVSDVNITVASTKLNETNATVIDQYFNTTTDANGTYELLLAFSDLNYIVKVDGDWLEANGYLSANPDLKSIKLDLGNPEVWVNFTLTSADVVDMTWLKGTVNDTDGNLSGVSIVVVIYADEPGVMNVTIDGLNATVNITTRTWMNLTATTDVNGSFAFSGIPFDAPAVGDFPVTSTQTYRHDMDAIPIPATAGSWEVMAGKTDYIDKKEVLKFKDGETTWWNISLVPITPPPEYKITGRVSPPDTKVMMGTTVVPVDNMTSGFTITNLTAGSYSLKFSAEHFVTQYRNVTISNADIDLGKITLVGIEEPGVFYTVYVGPFMDNGEAVVGIIVSFTYKGIPYSNKTLADGRAGFKIPVMYIPDGTEITATQGDVEEKWKWVDEEAPYEGVFINEKDPGSKGDSDVLLIVAIVVIVFIIIILVVLAMKSKGVGEEELFDEEIREYECPSCGAIVTSDMEICPECGETFEEEEFRCPECGELVENDATMCDSCGAEFEIPEKIEETEDDEEAEEEEEGEEEPEVLDEFDVVDEAETEDIDEMAGELEEEEGELEDLEDDLDLEDI